MLSQQFSLMAVAAILSMFSMANAHMIMKTPVPYGRQSLDNSPLLADGSNFPCKNNRADWDQAEGASNVMAIGEPQTLSFTGSAVHGGGSCQVSLTTDLSPTKNSKWMVIKSIEGGCPAAVAGNLPADPNGSGASTFQYTIPAGITPGQYTIAWSWINKIGNREFYMNCGPATITAAKKKRYAPAQPVKRQTSFPEMFVANLAGVNTCTTPEGFDYIYPNAGSVVQSAAASSGSYTQLVCGAAGANVPAASPSAAASAAGGSTSPSVTAAGAGAASSASAASGSPGVFATGAASGSAPATSTAVVSPLPAATSATAASPAAPAGTGSSGATSNVAGSPCSNEGAWSCAADGKSYQRCASGVWSVSMSMAAGMTCTPGTSSNINMAPGKAKRHEGHVRRSHNFFGRSSQ